MRTEFILWLSHLVGSGARNFPFFGEMDSCDPSQLSEAPTQVLHERSGGAASWQGIIKAVQTTVFPARRDIKEDFSDEAKFSPFYQDALEFALFPHARCPQHAQPVGIFSRTLAWAWVASEIKPHVGDLNWSLAKSLEAAVGLPPNTFRLTGNCRFPHYITAGMAQEWCELCMLPSEQRVARRG